MTYETHELTKHQGNIYIRMDIKDSGLRRREHKVEKDSLSIWEHNLDTGFKTLARYKKLVLNLSGFWKIVKSHDPHKVKCKRLEEVIIKPGI